MNLKQIKFEVPDTFTDVSRIYAYLGDERIGYASLCKEGNIVTLVDIYVYDRSRPFFKFLPMFKTGINFRNNGVGTELLKRVIKYCSDHGVREIRGAAKGNLAILKPWYVQHGFSISIDNEIHRAL